MSESHNRRTFLATAGITVASVVNLCLFAQPNATPPAPPPTIGTRESVSGMSADHPTIVSYRATVEAMKRLPVNKALSWQFQANMHGAKDEDGANEWWRWCMHGNSWFLTWHRGYIYFFEKIVRKMSGNDAFRLPYCVLQTATKRVSKARNSNSRERAPEPSAPVRPKGANKEPSVQVPPESVS